MLLGALLNNSFNFNIDTTTNLTAVFNEHVELFFNDIRREPLEDDSNGHYLAIYATLCGEEDFENRRDFRAALTALFFTRYSSFPEVRIRKQKCFFTGVS